MAASAGINVLVAFALLQQASWSPTDALAILRR
jgi:hypothetical protein